MRRASFIRAAAAAALLLAACGGSPARPAFDWKVEPLATPAVLTPFWQSPLVMNKERSFNPYEGGGAVGDPAGGRIFVGTCAGRFYALGSSGGSMIWKHAGSDAINCTPAFDREEGVVYFGDDGGKLTALRADDGALLFQYDAGGEVRGRPVVSGRALFFKDLRGKVHAVDAAQGNGLWVFAWTQPEGFIVESSAGVAVHEETVLAGFADGRAVGIDLIDGTERWRSDLSEFVPGPAEGEGNFGGGGLGESGAASSKIDVNTTPVVAGGEAVFSSFRGGLFSLDPADGSILWRRGDLVMASGLAAQGDELYVSLTNKGVVRLSIAGAGETVWSSWFSSRTISDAVVYEGYVVVTDSSFGLIVLDRETGKVLDRFAPMWGSSAPADVVAGRVIVHSNGGSVYTFFIK